MSTKRKTGIYCRISSDPEGRQAGVERQEADARKMAAQRGWEVVETYTDNDVSAYTGRSRPAWERMLTDLRAGRINAVVAYSSSRMYRRLHQLQPLIDLCQANGVKIATCVSGDIDLTTADGIMLANILASVDQAEAMRTSERLKAAFKNGKAPGGSRRAFGYTLDWKIDRKEAGLIRDAVQRIIGGASAYSICADWTARGIRTPYSATWRPSKLVRMLTGRHLVGDAKGRPAILSEEEHDLLVAALTAPRPHKTRRDARGRVASPGRPARKFPALGILHCGKCSEPLQGGGKQYSCQSAGCAGVGVRAFEAEHVLAEYVVGMQGGDAKEPARVDSTPNLAPLRALERRYSEVQDAIVDGSMPAKPGANILAKIDAEREQLQSQVRASIQRQVPVPTMDELVKRADDFVARWKDRTLTEAERADLQAMLQAGLPRERYHVVVKPAARKNAKKFDASRIVIRERKQRRAS